MNERKIVTTDQLNSRREKIDLVVERISQFPRVGSEIIIDRNTQGLEGPDYVEKLIQLSEPAGLLDDIKEKFATKTVPALHAIGGKIDIQIETHKKSSENLEKIRSLVEEGRLPKRYLEEAQKAYNAFSTPQAENTHPQQEKDEQTVPESVTPPEHQEEPEVEDEAKLEEEKTEFDFTTVDGVQVNVKEGQVSFGEYSIVLDETERHILNQLYESNGDWVETLNLIAEAAKGNRGKFNQKLATLREKLRENSLNQKLIISSGFGRLGGKYRFGLENLQGYEPKEEERVAIASEVENSNQSVSQKPEVISQSLSVSEPSEKKDDRPSIALPNGEIFTSGEIQMNTLMPLLQNIEEGLTNDEWAELAFGSRDDEAKKRLSGNITQVKNKLSDLGYQVEKRSLGGVYRYFLIEKKSDVSSQAETTAVIEEDNSSEAQVQVQETTSQVFAEPEEEVATSQIPVFEEIAAPISEPQDEEEPVVGEEENLELTTIEFEEEESGKFDRQDVMILADFISRPEELYLKELGLDVNLKDQREIGDIAKNLKQAFEEEGIVVDLDVATESLVRKLKAFVKDAERVFMENDENEDAQFLLATLSSLDEEQMDKFSSHL